MKKRFEESELKVLEGFLVRRIIKINASAEPQCFTDELKPVKALNCIVLNVDLLEKVKAGVAEYSGNELLIFTSCINENMPSLHQKALKLNSANPYTCSTEQKESRTTLAICMGILSKTGFFDSHTVAIPDYPISLHSMQYYLDKLKQLFRPSRELQ